jgi:hypothetical protein
MEKSMTEKQVDEILDEALTSFPDMRLPASFTDRLVHKVEVRLKWTVLLSEFGLKIALVVAILALLGAALFFPSRSTETNLPSIVVQYRYSVAGIAFIAFFTFLFDQVVLRWLFFRRGRSARQS